MTTYNHISIIKRFFCTIILITSSYALAQNKGKLFIIGGGPKTPKLIRHFIGTTTLTKKDYIAVLPMSSEEPDSAFYYFKKQIGEYVANPIVNLNFDKKLANDKKWNDSLQKAKIIFITGGDQNKFMDVVLGTEIEKSIKKAYKNGSTIGGTSAGAAVMSKFMITGNQILETKYAETFDNIRYGNIEIKEGLGMVENLIVDQHFLKRSRYNRLISALIDYPNLIGVGIDESTAIIVDNNTFKVVGESQVIVMEKPKKITKKDNHLVGVSSINMSVLSEGMVKKMK